MNFSEFINEKIKYWNETRAIREKEIEAIIVARFKERKDELDALSAELAEKEKSIEKTVQGKVQERQNRLTEFEASLKSREKELQDEFSKKEEQLRAEIKEREEKLSRFSELKDAEYDKRADDVAEQIKRLEEEKEQALADIRKYGETLYSVDSRVTSWIKRADRKEISIFEEIQAGLDIYQKYGKTASEEGFDFEKSFAALLNLNGYSDVTVTQQSQDFGADVLATKDGIKFVFQCKYYTKPVGVEAVQQVLASKIHYHAHTAVVATNHVFTMAAKTLAEENGVALWDCEKIAQLKEDAKEVEQEPPSQ